MQHLQKTGGGGVLWLTSFLLSKSRSFFSSTYELPPFSSRETVSFFSYAYKLPIFYPLCFDIHASDGGCRGYPRAFFSSRADPAWSGPRSLLAFLPASLFHCFITSLLLYLTPAGWQKQCARAAGTTQRNPATASTERTFC